MSPGRWPATVLPALSLTLSQYAHAIRVFKDEPKWTPLNRSTEVDSNVHRQEYVSQYLSN